jgi:Tetratricopeptide repeat
VRLPRSQACGATQLRAGDGDAAAVREAYQVSAHNLGEVLRALGEHEQARTLIEDTLTRRRRVLGDDHPDTLRTTATLAENPPASGEAL